MQAFDPSADNKMIFFILEDTTSVFSKKKK